MISASTVSGVYGIAAATVLLCPLVLLALATINRTGGSVMTDRRRARLIAGAAFIALAAVVGLFGYLKLSLEPDVNRQIPYLASAGMALVLLSAVGGALIVAEQLRADEDRMQELESAVGMLAAAVAAGIEAPARVAPSPRKRATASRSRT